MTLWLSAAVLTALSLALLLWPLLRAAAAPAPARAYDIEIYRDQLGELDRDLERGVIDAEEAKAARVEIERRLLAAAEDRDQPQKHTSGWRRVAAVVLVVAVPAAAGVIYLQLGTPDLPGHPFAERQDQASAMARAQSADTTARIADLKRRLQETPDDLPALIEIARAYRGAARFAEAAAAFGRAIQVAGELPILLSAYGEALTLANGGTVSPEAVATFQKALEGSPEDFRARFYLGLARSQAGDAREALAIWVRLEANAPAGAPWLAEIAGRIKALAAESGIDLAALRAAQGVNRPAATATGPDSPSPSKDDLKAAQDMSPEQRSEMIRGMVARLAKRLEENPDDLEGWRRLARSYQILGEPQKAAEARTRVEALEKAQPRAEEKTPRATEKAPGTAGAGQSIEAQQDMIRNMVAGLAERLKQDPNNLAGWQRLGRSYLVLGEPQKAVQAYARAAALAPKNTAVLTDYAEALLNAHGTDRNLPLPFVAVMRDILTIDQGNALALWYVGLAESQAGKPRQAEALWRRLLAILPPAAPERANLEKRLQALPKAD